MARDPAPSSHSRRAAAAGPRRYPAESRHRRYRGRGPGRNLSRRLMKASFSGVVGSIDSRARPFLERQPDHRSGGHVADGFVVGGEQPHQFVHRTQVSALA